jgi:hypothetical protein
MNLRLGVVIVVLVGAAALAWRGLWALWMAVAMGYGEYHLIFDWLDPFLLLLIGLHLFLGLALGFFVAFFGRPTRPILVAAVAGVLLEFALNFRSRSWLTPELRYGFYFAAPLGSMLGAHIAAWVQGKRRAAAV